MYCTELNILHINICRNASSSISRAFKTTFPQYETVNQHHSINSLCVPPPDGVISTYRSFTVVRNPYDRAVSMWLWHPKRWGLPFKGFFQRVEAGWYARRGRRYSPISGLGIDWPHVPQIDWLTNEAGQVQIDKILRYETLQEDMDALCIDWQLPQIQIPYLNTSQERTGKRRLTWRFYYDPESFNMVGNYFRKDFEAFNYKLEI